MGGVLSARVQVGPHIYKCIVIYYECCDTQYAIRNTQYAIRNTQYAIRNTQYVSNTPRGTTSRYHPL